jgi:MarR family transcriptional regulator, transcriptional regulator for hemolysin
MCLTGRMRGGSMARGGATIGNQRHGRREAAAAPPAEAPVPVQDQGARIGFLIHDVSRMRRTLYDQAVRPLGLTRAQWWVLAQVSREPPSGVLQTDLARVLDVGKVTVGGLIDRLEASGFVERRPDAVDRRAKRVVITAQGRVVLRDMVKLARRLNDETCEGMTAGDLAVLEQVLQRMKANIKARLEEG